MQQPEPIKPNSVYISDHRTLVDLGNVIRYTGGCILKLREAVDSYLQGVENAMQNKIEEFYQQLDSAQRVLCVAQQALCACRDSRYYDDEKEEWIEPSCSCEERDVANAQKEVNRIQKIIEKLQPVKNEVEHELYEYRQPYGIISPGGGDGVLQWLGDTHSNNAVDRMQKILDVVEKYLRVNIHDINSPLSISNIPADVDSWGYSTAENKKEKGFRKSIELILDRQRENNFGDHKIHEANAIPLCPCCHRPYPIACICGMVEKEREHIFNYDLSR